MGAIVSNGINSCHRDILKMAIVVRRGFFWVGMGCPFLAFGSVDRLAEACYIWPMRIALGIEYDGAGFCGWQRQAEGLAVQEVVERALAGVAGHPVELACAGRTDKGVHATQQVVHFDAAAVRPDHAWVLGVAGSLPPSVRVLWARRVGEEFHARFGALGRRYRYLLWCAPVAPAIQRGQLGWEFHPLQLAPMQSAASRLIGTHDFSAFRSSECQSRQPVRTLRQLEVEQAGGPSGQLFAFTVEADAFLHHMVRNLVGTLIAVGRGEQPPEWVSEVLAARDRARAGITAPAQGLYFCGARYAPEHGLPGDRLPMVPG